MSPAVISRFCYFSVLTWEPCTVIKNLFSDYKTDVDKIFDTLKFIVRCSNHLLQYEGVPRYERVCLTRTPRPPAWVSEKGRASLVASITLLVNCGRRYGDFWKPVTKLLTGWRPFVSFKETLNLWRCISLWDVATVLLLYYYTWVRLISYGTGFKPQSHG